MRTLSFILLAFIVSACSTPAPQQPPTWPPPEKAPSELEPRIDYVGLQHTLNMDRAPEQLGYEEKPFETCSVGNGYSHSDHCRTAHLAVIQFQLMCRDTDENASAAVANDSIHPIANRTLDWTLMKRKGQIQTDDSGYGQIRMAFDRSASNQRLKINLGRQFLYMQAGDITRVVTPKIWCTTIGL